MACTSFYETAILRFHSSHSFIYCTIERLTALAEIWCNSFHSHQKPLDIGVFNTCIRFSSILLYGIMVILSAGLHTEEQNSTTTAALWIIKRLYFKAINSC